MILKKSGQTFQYGQKTFAVGGIVSTFAEPEYEMYGIIQEINTDKASHPTALCNFGGDDILDRPLRDLEPVALGVPFKNGQSYVLYYICDGEDGQRSKVLGVSADKGVLLRLMLEDVKDDTQVSLATAFSKDNWIIFRYENAELADMLYLDYFIAPVTIYSKMEGDAAV